MLGSLIKGLGLVVRTLLVLISLALIIVFLSEYSEGDASRIWFYLTVLCGLPCFLNPANIALLLFIAPAFVETILLIIRLKKRIPPPFSPDD